MRFFQILSFMLVAVAATNIYCQSPKPVWLEKIRQIHLLADTYDDVLETLQIQPVGSPTERKLLISFDFEGGRLSAEFASGRCVITPYSGGDPIGWNVPQGTVTNVSFRFSEAVTKAKVLDWLGTNLGNFRKTKISDVPNALIYRNSKRGVEFSVSPDGTVEEVEFFPPSASNNRLCRATGH